MNRMKDFFDIKMIKYPWLLVLSMTTFVAALYFDRAYFSNFPKGELVLFGAVFIIAFIWSILNYVGHLQVRSIYGKFDSIEDFISCLSMKKEEKEELAEYLYDFVKDMEENGANHEAAVKTAIGQFQVKEITERDGDLIETKPHYYLFGYTANTILIVEHDPDVISISDHIIEMGPQSGKKGGQMTFSGSYSCFCSSTSLTAQYLAQRKALKKAPRKANGWFQITNANLFNLCNVNVNVPKGVMTVVTGVAGSGKSTLFNRIFPVSYPECIVVDQKSITTNRRSNVATFIDAFDDIRGLFSKENNVDPSWFSLNSKGACPNCKGLGTVEYDLAFMENVTEVCEVCNGKRFIPKVLNYTCCQKNISDILQMSINEALDFFDRGSIREKIVPLQKVGLGFFFPFSMS